MIKKLLTTLALLLIPSFCFATYTTTWTASSTSGTILTQPTRFTGTTLVPYADHFIASSSAPSRFPYASTTQVTADSICLNSDICRTTWPTSGSGGSGSVSTSTADVSGQVTFFTSNSATPALIGGSSSFAWNNTTKNLTATYASTTAFTVSGNSYLGTVSSGTWNGTTVGTGFGGTGLAAVGASSTILQSNGSANVYQKLSPGNFTTSNVSQWTNDAGYLTNANAVTSVSVSSPNSSLSVGGGPITTTGTLTGDLNLNHRNDWLAIQTFVSASSTSFSALDGIFVGRTATSTVRGDNVASILPYASTTAISVSGLTSGNCVQASTGGFLVSAAAACGSGSSAFPFTAVAGGNATSTLLYLYSGLYTLGSTTIQYASSTALTVSGGTYLCTTGVSCGVGTTTPSWPLSVYKANGGQIALSDGPGVTQWVNGISNDGSMYWATTTLQGTATSSPSAITVYPTGTGLFVGTTTNVNATGLAVQGTGFWKGLTTAAGVISGGSYLCQDANFQVISDTSTCLVSTRRMKNSIEPLTGSLEKVMRLNPVSFMYNMTGNKEFDKRGPQIGFIAEDVATVEPRLVPLDESGLPFQVRYENMTALLAGAIQELANVDVKKKTQDNWQWLAIGVLFFAVIYQQRQISKLKK